MASTPNIVDYKGLLITSPEPSEQGGQMLITDIKLIGDRLEVVDQQITSLDTRVVDLSANMVTVTTDQVISGLKIFEDIRLTNILDQHVLIADDDGNIVDSGFTTEDLLGSGNLSSINDVHPDDLGNVDLTSPDNSLTVTPVPDSNEVELTIYVAIEGSISNTVGTVEKGQSVSSVGFNWSYNNGDADPESQEIKIGSTVIATPVNSTRSTTYNPSSPLTSTTTFTLDATDGTNNDTSTTSVTFRNKRYWGVTANRPMPDSEILSGNDGAEFSSDRNKTINYDASAGGYFWFAYPTSFGLADVKVGGSSFSSWYDGSGESTSPQTRSFTNASGHTEDYYVYISFNLQNSSDIEVIFS